MLNQILAIRSVRNPADEPVDRDFLNSPSRSVGHMVRHRITDTPSRPAFRYRNATDSGWDRSNWADVGEETYRIAAGLMSLGVGIEDRVAIISLTSYRWILANFAITCAGATTTTVYSTSHPDEVSHVLGSSGSSVVFAENAEQVDKLRSRRNEFPEITTVVTLDDSEDGGDWTITLSDLARRGAAALADDPDLVDRRIDRLTPDHIASVIYTSGTTGRPKGVRLKHGSWTYTGAAVRSAGSVLSEDDLQYLWLPLAHAFGQVLLSLCLEIGFETAVDGRQEKIADQIGEVKPTLMAAVPRRFEKIRSGVIRMLEDQGGVKAKLFTWASSVAVELVDVVERDRKPSPGLKVRYRLADKLVLSRIRERFGGRLRFIITGSAALDRDVAKWFTGLGVIVAEG